MSESPYASLAQFIAGSNVTNEEQSQDSNIDFSNNTTTTTTAQVHVSADELSSAVMRQEDVVIATGPNPFESGFDSVNEEHQQQLFEENFESDEDDEVVYAEFKAFEELSDARPGTERQTLVELDSSNTDTRTSFDCIRSDDISSSMTSSEVVGVPLAVIDDWPADPAAGSTVDVSASLGSRFHKDVADRYVAEQRLRDRVLFELQTNSGDQSSDCYCAFLVRRSSTQNGVFVLSIFSNHGPTDNQVFATDDHQVDPLLRFSFRHLLIVQESVGLSEFRFSLKDSAWDSVDTIAAAHGVGQSYSSLVHLLDQSRELHHANCSLLIAKAPAAATSLLSVRDNATDKRSPVIEARPGDGSAIEPLLVRDGPRETSVLLGGSRNNTTWAHGQRDLITDILIGYDNDDDLWDEEVSTAARDPLHFRLSFIDIMRGFAVVSALVLVPQNIFADAATSTAPFFQFPGLFPNVSGNWEGLHWADICIMPIFAFVMGLCLALAAENTRCSKRVASRKSAAGSGIKLFSWLFPSHKSLGFALSGQVVYRDEGQTQPLSSSPAPSLDTLPLDDNPVVPLSTLVRDFGRVTVRAGILLLLGMFVSWLMAGFVFDDMLLTGPLQRLSVLYFVAALVYRLKYATSQPWLGAIARPFCVVVFLTIYLAVVYALYVPACGSARHDSPSCNAVSYADQQMFGTSHVRSPSDPFGYFASFTYILIVLVGAEYGCGLHKVHCDICELYRNNWNHRQLFIQWVGLGTSLLASGFILSDYVSGLIAFNATMGSLSFVTFTAGLLGLFATFLYISADVAPRRVARKVRGVLLLLRWCGTNPLLLFIGPQLVLSFFYGVVKVDGGKTSFWRWLFDHGFMTWIYSQHVGQVVMAVTWALIWVVLGWRLFRRRWFVRL